MVMINPYLQYRAWEDKGSNWFGIIPPCVDGLQMKALDEVSFPINPLENLPFYIELISDKEKDQKDGNR